MQINTKKKKGCCGLKDKLRAIWSLIRSKEYCLIVVETKEKQDHLITHGMGGPVIPSFIPETMHRLIMEYITGDE